MKSLRIVKRDDKYVIQILQKRFFTRRNYWIDLHKIRTENQMNTLKFTGLLLPIKPTIFKTQDEAEEYCTKSLTKKRVVEDKEIKTYNTGLHDVFWGNPTPMPKCNPPKEDV